MDETRSSVVIVRTLFTTGTLDIGFVAICFCAPNNKPKKHSLISLHFHHHHRHRQFIMYYRYDCRCRRRRYHALATPKINLGLYNYFCKSVCSSTRFSTKVQRILKFGGGWCID